ncbi:MAG: alpha/beta fold hydrolase [Candidatus Omnitrophota bacterium]
MDNPQTVNEKIEFVSKGIPLTGKVCRPADLAKCKGIVIFTHGLGYCVRQYKIDGEYFARNGYLLLTYNLRGHAGTPGDWSMSNSVDDLIESISFLINNYKFSNNERICVLGHSTGALITLLASLKDSRIKFGSLVTTVTCLADSYLHWFKSGFNKEVGEYFKSKGKIPEIIDRFRLDSTMLNQYRDGKLDPAELNIGHRYGLLKSGNLGSFFHEIAYSDDILKHIEQIEIPLLLFRGEDDEVMDVQKTNELYEKLNQRIPTRLYITDSKNHFHNDRWELIQAETLKFFDVFCDYRKKAINFSDKHVLLVDDEPLVTRSLKKLLVQDGISNVWIAENGDKALQMVKELRSTKSRSFDLIISDIRMPGIDGIETIKRAKDFISNAHGKESPVIFITGYEGDANVERAKQIGYVDYLYKPLDIKHFLTSVKKQLQCSNV